MFHKKQLRRYRNYYRAVRIEKQQAQSEGVIYPSSAESYPSYLSKIRYNYTRDYTSVLFANVDEIDLYLEYMESSGNHVSYEKRRVVERRPSARNRMVRFRTLR